MKISDENLIEMFDTLKQIYAEAIEYDVKAHKSYEKGYRILDRFILILNEISSSDILIKGTTIGNNIYIQSDSFKSDIFELLTQMRLEYTVKIHKESIVIKIDMENVK